MSPADKTNDTILNYLIDLDGVLVRGHQTIPGSELFIRKLLEKQRQFLVLTNNSLYTPRDLAHLLQINGLEIPPERIYTSAMATAQFLHNQKPDGTAFVIGESGLTNAIHNAGYVITEIDPDYVVLGETSTYNFEVITHAIRQIERGAHFIATNLDVTGPSESGTVPGCGAMAALIEKATGKRPFFVGKPNPLMMRSALNYLNIHSENTLMIGDRMDTDIVAGVESGLRTLLVLSGVTTLSDIDRYPFRPTWIKKSVAEIEV